MEEQQEKIKLISRNLVNKLLEKFDKCNWQNRDGIFLLPLGIAGSVKLKKDHLYMYNLHGDLILQYQPTAQQNDAYNMAVLYGKVITKHKTKTDDLIEEMIDELNKL